MRRHWMCAGAAFAMLLAGCSADKSSATGAPALPAGVAFSGGRAFADLKKQCDFGPRNPGSKGHAECRAWLQKELGKTADKVRIVSFQKTLGGKQYTFTNIVGVYGDTSASPVLLCAHWDTRPFADQEIDPVKAKQPILGANDGASGVAALLEIGRMLKQKKPPVGVVIIFFDGEDWGKTPQEMFFGSTSFANSWKRVMEGVTASFRYGILLDMVGAKDMEIPREPISEQAAPKLVQRIWATARAGGMERYFPDRTGPAITDDHVPLIEKGIPAVDLICFDYPYWHTLEDTPDKCSAQSLHAVGTVVAMMLYGEERAPHPVR